MTDLLDLLKTYSPELFDEKGNFKWADFQTALTQTDTQFSHETYRLDWRGKSYAKALVYDENRTLLSANHAHNETHKDSQNILIQGDNLAVLKHLREAYRKQIKMIYIDPPYNTGSDGFVYQDDRKYTPAQIAQITGESEETAEYIHEFINAKASSHSAWLTFMYPRLKIARELLKDDGVIFISIDDNEQAQLKLLCDEIFGEGNFVAKCVHKNNSNKNQSKFIGVSTEYIFIYAKSLFNLSQSGEEWRIRKSGVQDIAKKFNQLKKMGLSLAEIDIEIKEMYKRPKYAHLSRWNKVDENGVFKDENLSREGGRKDYTIINPNTGKPCVIPPRGWGKSYEELLELQKLDLIWYGDENTAPGYKYYIEEEQLSVSDNFWYFDNSIDTKFIKKTFNGLVFENPKPLEMIKRILELPNTKNDLILDFFAGSGTTAHAVMQLNSEDNGNRKFICVQLDEPVKDKSEAQKAGFDTIFEITKARIQKSAQKIKTENPNYTGDLSFKEYRIVPVPEHLGVLPDSPEQGLAWLDNLQLSDADCQNILTTWCVQDGMPLHDTPQAVDLGGYTAYQYDTVLYLIYQGFNTVHLTEILRRLDDTQDEFNIEKIVILEPHFTSVAKRELCEAVAQYKPRKGNKLYFISRHRADKGQ